MEDQLYNDSFADGDVDISQTNMTDFHKDFSFRDGVNVTGYTIMSAGKHSTVELIVRILIMQYVRHIRIFFCFVRIFVHHSHYICLPKKRLF